MNEINFNVICSCGLKIEGTFGDKDNHERLHCKCGLVWDIKRPWKEK